MKEVGKNSVKLGTLIASLIPAAASAQQFSLPVKELAKTVKVDLRSDHKALLDLLAKVKEAHKVSGKSGFVTPTLLDGIFGSDCQVCGYNQGGTYEKGPNVHHYIQHDKKTDQSIFDFDPVIINEMALEQLINSKFGPISSRLTEINPKILAGLSTKIKPN